MAGKIPFLGKNGITFLWQLIKNKFVAKEEGKGLSSNDFTDAEKAKLSDIAQGANKTTVVDGLTSNSGTDALSAKQGKVLDDKIKGISTDLENLGAGDMMKATYDSNADGKVDSADNADKLGGKAATYYAAADSVPTSTSQLTNDRGFVTNEDVTTALAGKSDSGHKHTAADITDFATEMSKKANATHGHAQSEITGLADKLGELEELAQGKCKTLAFNTKAELDTYISNVENKAKLKVGDVFLIVDLEVPDYWWDGTQLQELEARKIEFEEITNAELEEIFNS